jgi:hypothetical protein
VAVSLVRLHRPTIAPGDTRRPSASKDLHAGMHRSRDWLVENGMGRWRKLHNEELRDLYSSPSIIRIIKARRTR